MIVTIIIFSMRFPNLNFFHDKLGMPYIQSIKQSMIKLNINKQICCYGYILLINYSLLISIYKSVQNLLLKKCFRLVFIKACKIYENKK